MFVVDKPTKQKLLKQVSMSLLGNYPTKTKTKVRRLSLSPKGYEPDMSTIDREFNSNVAAEFGIIRSCGARR